MLLPRLLQSLLPLAHKFFSFVESFWVPCLGTLFFSARDPVRRGNSAAIETAISVSLRLNSGFASGLDARAHLRLFFRDLGIGDLFAAA